MARWIWFHVHDRIDIRLTGPTLEAAGLPGAHRPLPGVPATSGTRACASRTGSASACAWAATLRVETSAVDAPRVNAAAVDGLKIEPMVLAEVRLARGFWLRRLRRHLHARCHGQPSGFDPTAPPTATDAGGNDLDRSLHGAPRGAGAARPPTAPTRASMQDFGLTMTAKF